MLRRTSRVLGAEFQPLDFTCFAEEGVIIGLPPFTGPAVKDGHEEPVLLNQTAQFVHLFGGQIPRPCGDGIGSQSQESPMEIEMHRHPVEVPLQPVSSLIGGFLPVAEELPDCPLCLLSLLAVDSTLITASTTSTRTPAANPPKIDMRMLVKRPGGSHVINPPQHS